MEIKTEIRINATADKVWKILTNFTEYPKWNPFIKSIKGETIAGSHLKVVLDGMTFKPKVLTYEPNKEFRWLGHLLFKGLFDGEHSFQIQNNPDGSVTFEQNEKFSGILIPIFKKKLNTDTKKGFEAMNNKLKEIAERK